jgi:hypothetical protein
MNSSVLKRSPEGSLSYLLACLLYGILNIGDVIPKLFSATFYEDWVRLILSPLRGKNHPSTLLAKLRTSDDFPIPESSLKNLCSRWQFLPTWVKQELGFYVLYRNDLFSKLEIPRNPTISAETPSVCDEENQTDVESYTANWDKGYFELLQGVFSSGTLTEFIRAVHLFEAAHFAFWLNLDGTLHPAAMNLSLNACTSVPGLVRDSYPTLRRIRTLRVLRKLLERIPVQSQGKYWLECLIAELSNLHFTFSESNRLK